MTVLVMLQELLCVQATGVAVVGAGVRRIHSNSFWRVLHVRMRHEACLRLMGELV